MGLLWRRWKPSRLWRCPWRNRGLLYSPPPHSIPIAGTSSTRTIRTSTYSAVTSTISPASSKGYTIEWERSCRISKWRGRQWAASRCWGGGRQTRRCRRYDRRRWGWEILILRIRCRLWGTFWWRKAANNTRQLSYSSAFSCLISLWYIINFPHQTLASSLKLWVFLSFKSYLMLACLRYSHCMDCFGVAENSIASLIWIVWTKWMMGLWRDGGDAIESGESQ